MKKIKELFIKLLKAKQKQIKSSYQLIKEFNSVEFIKRKRGA